MRIHSLSAGLALSVLAAFPSTAHGQLWKNGIFDGFSALSSEINTDVTDSRVYDNFIASGSGWTVSSLFGEFLTDFEATDAYWEIRSGISLGLGGTLLYSGTNSVTGTDLGDALGFDHVLYSVSGFTPFHLAPGEYWLTIAPTDAGFGRAYIGTTSGDGSINAISDLKAFWDSQQFGQSFSDASEGIDAFSDYAYGLDGVEGTPSSTVPEPSSVILLATGLGVLTFAAYRRRRVA